MHTSMKIVGFCASTLKNVLFNLVYIWYNALLSYAFNIFYSGALIVMTLPILGIVKSVKLMNCEIKGLNLGFFARMKTVNSFFMVF